MEAFKRVLDRPSPVPKWVVDLALGALIVLVGVTTTGSTLNGNVTYESRDALAWTLILMATVPYFVRRRAPVAVFTISLAAVATLMFENYSAGALPWVVLVGAYTVAAHCTKRMVLVSATFTGVILIALVVGAPDFGVGELVAAAGAYGAAMLIGWSMQTRRARIDTFEEEQEEAARRAVADERLRIAQELHDVVAHSLGVIAVQSGAGMLVLDSDPAEARRAFESISRTSRTSLAEIRRLLGRVRDGEGPPAYTPAPGLVDLSRLVDGVARTGLSVDVTINGPLDDVPPGVGLAAYRIVQEALTNTLRHAHARVATVRLDSRPGELAVEVADDGRGSNGTRPGGHGLVGMRERVAVYGGVLDAGPGAAGGFRVVARLPYEEAVA